MSIDRNRLSQLSGIDLSNSTDTFDEVNIQVNSTKDPSASEINYYDNEISFREALLIVESLRDKPLKVRPARPLYANIKFADEPIEGSNGDDLPPWLIKLKSQLPNLQGAKVTVNDERSPNSIIFMPERDAGGNFLTFRKYLWSLEDGPVGSSTQLSLNRVSFTNFGGTPTEPEGEKPASNYFRIIRDGIRSGNDYSLKITNSTFQNLKQNENHPTDFAVPVYGGKYSKQYLDNVYVKNNDTYINGPSRDTIVHKARDFFYGESEIYNSYLIDGDAKTPAKVTSSEGEIIRTSEKKPSIRDYVVGEARSYLYKNKVAHLTPEPAYKLRPNQADIVILRYDRPTDGDITLFSDFSKLVDQVKENTDNISKASRKLIEQSKIGTDVGFWDGKIKDQEDVIKHAKAEKSMAGVNFGLSLLSSVVGVDIKGIAPGQPAQPARITEQGSIIGGTDATSPRLESKFSTRMEVYKRAPGSSKFRSGLTTAMGAFPLVAGLVSEGIKLGNRLSELDAQVEEAEGEIKKLNVYKEKAEENRKEVIRLGEENRIKMKEFENGTFTPAVNLSINQIKYQRTVATIEDFEFGKDILNIPSFGENTVTSLEDFKEGSKGGFRVRITDRDKDESSFVVADVYVADYNQTIDYGLAARQAQKKVGKEKGQNFVIGNGYQNDIKQQTVDYRVASPLNATIKISRAEISEDKTLLTTTTANSGDDTVIGTNGYETIYGLAGDDIFKPYYGKDTIYGGTGTDVAMYNIASPVKLTSVAAAGGSPAYVSAGHHKFTGGAYYADFQEQTFDSKLYSMESFFVSPFSQLEMSKLPSLTNQDNLYTEEDDVYKFTISAGVRLVASEYDDWIEFVLPSADVEKYFDSESELTPQFGSLEAFIDGGAGNNTLNLEEASLPKGYKFTVDYDGNSESASAPKSGMIYLEKGEGDLHKLIRFQNISDVYPRDLHQKSASDVVETPLKAHDMLYDVSVDSEDDQIASVGNDSVRPMLSKKNVYGGEGLDAAIYDMGVPVLLTAKKDPLTNEVYVLATPNSATGVALYDLNQSMKFSQKLFSFETFQVSPFSQLRMGDMLAPDNGEKYKFIITAGVDVVATDYDDVLEYILPDDVVTNYTNASSSLTPPSGSFGATVDGGAGENSLVLSERGMPGGYHYSVQYNGDSRDSGVVYLESKDEQLYELVRFENMTILNAPFVHVASESDEIVEPASNPLLPDAQSMMEGLQ